MNDLVYLTLVVRIVHIDEYGSMDVEIHIYSDNWLESFLDGVLHQSHRFTLGAA